MKKGIIQINKYATSSNTVESQVCFRSFIEFLQQKIKTESNSRLQFYKIVLDKLMCFPELYEGISIQQTVHYDEILELVSAIIFPLVENEDEILVGLASASTPEVFYASNAFYKMFEANPDEVLPQQWLDEDSLTETHLQYQYNLVLKKLYGLALPEKTEMIHSFLNPITGLYQYFRLHVDTRFADVKIKDGMELPDARLVNACFDCSDTSAKIESMLPLDYFTATGFCIIALTDITVQQATEQIGKAVVRIDKKENPHDGYHRVIRLLQTIAGSSKYQFGLMPFFTINKRAALPYENFDFSILVKTFFNAGISKTVFTRYINHFINNPVGIDFEYPGNVSVLPVPVEKALVAAGYYYYSLVPIFFNQKLVGILEVAAQKNVPVLDDLQGNKLKPVMPYLAQLMMLAKEQFDMAIDTIIKDKFTNIQPSVQWKFNEVAWHYFRSHDIENKNEALEKIIFKEVYPLYGAVDIRNSTIERNKVLREDLEFQLGLLIVLLNDLSKHTAALQVQHLINKCRQWIEKMKAYVSVEEEQELNELLFSEIHPFINSFENLPAALTEKIQFYYQSIDKDAGQSYLKRRQLENAMQKINQALGQYFDLFKDELQLNYPCYFEKFRTDGVEYDIYIGQSIAPSIAFTEQHLQKLRQWQLQSMAAITKLTHSLLAQLHYPLQTTQLIFINARAIDISFRNDERRFDVEGAYNIRYHIVKKRIDKVHLSGTAERLTQPGKIAIVYFNERDAEVYTTIIQKLQKETILLDDLEHLELEELQGVAGLKALRVGVKLD